MLTITGKGSHCAVFLVSDNCIFSESRLFVISPFTLGSLTFSGNMTSSSIIFLVNLQFKHCRHPRLQMEVKLCPTLQNEALNATSTDFKMKLLKAEAQCSRTKPPDLSKEDLLLRSLIWLQAFPFLIGGTNSRSQLLPVRSHPRPQPFHVLKSQADFPPGPLPVLGIFLHFSAQGWVGESGDSSCPIAVGKNIEQF